MKTLIRSVMSLVADASLDDMNLNEEQTQSLNEMIDDVVAANDDERFDKMRNFSKQLRTMTLSSETLSQ